MRRWATLLALAVPLAGAVDEAGAQANRPGGRRMSGCSAPGRAASSRSARSTRPPASPRPTVIFTRDLVMRVAAFDVAYHQRAIETAAALPDGGLEFRFVPAAPVARALGGRLPPDIGFGCGGSPDLLRVQRRGPDEIAFPDCTDFPSPLKRCVAR